MIFTKKDKRTNLEKEIEAVITYMSALAPDSVEYTTIVTNLEKLCKARDDEKSREVKPDTYWIVGGNIVGIVLVLCYEKIDIITSKAFGLIIKGRV